MTAPFLCGVLLAVATAAVGLALIGWGSARRAPGDL